MQEFVAIKNTVLQQHIATLCTCGHLGFLKRCPAARRRLGPSKTFSKSDRIGTNTHTHTDTDLGASWLPPGAC